MKYLTILLACAVLALGVGCTSEPQNVRGVATDAPHPGATVGEFVSDVTFVDTHGTRKSLKSFRDDAYIVAFVNQDCKKAYPDDPLVKLARRMKGRVRVVEVSIAEDDCSKFNECVERRGPETLKNLVLICDGSEAMREAFKTSGPTVYLLDDQFQVKSVGTLENLDTMGAKATQLAQVAERRRRDLLRH